MLSDDDRIARLESMISLLTGQLTYAEEERRKLANRLAAVEQWQHEVDEEARTAEQPQRRRFGVIRGGGEGSGPGSRSLKLVAASAMVLALVWAAVPGINEQQPETPQAIQPIPEREPKPPPGPGAQETGEREEPRQGSPTRAALDRTTLPAPRSPLTPDGPEPVPPTSPEDDCLRARALGLRAVVCPPDVAAL